MPEYRSVIMSLPSSASLQLEAVSGTFSKVFHQFKFTAVIWNVKVRKLFLLGLIAGIPSALLIALRNMRYQKKQRDVKKLRELKQSERKSNFNCIRAQLLAKNYKDEDDDILSMDFEELRSELQTRRVTAKQVVEAHIRKCLELANDLNCVTEFLLDALEKADSLDKRILVQGPLHGIPFCVNDDIDLEKTTPSFSCSMNFPSTGLSLESAVLVKVLESLGAIPICRASTSIICMSYGSRNPFFGEILNPINKKLSAGGSSCGTSCLVQGGGVPFGIGTDRAGGARVPAHLSGITTLKPSRHRISRKGCTQHCVGTTTVPCIMTKRVNDLCTLYGFVMDKNQQHKFDPKIVPLPWNTQVCTSKQKLRVGCFKSLPAYTPMGDTEKALDRAKYYLESCGHLVVDCEPPDDLKCQEVWKALLKYHEYRHNFKDSDKLSMSLSTSALNETSNLNKKQISPRVLWAEESRRVKKAHYGSSCWRSIFGRLDHVPGRKSSRERAIEQMHTTMNSDCDLWNTSSLREVFVDEVLDTMNQQNVDVMICPVFGHMAATPDIMLKSGLSPGVYTFLWNLLDLPAGVVRVWKESGMNLSEDYEESIGMPIGIQVIGRPYNEELVIRLMMELDEINDDTQK